MLRSLRYATATLRLEDWWKRRRRNRNARRHSKPQTGHCPICNAAVAFLPISESPREQLQCVGCGSVPRQRALIHLLRRQNLIASDVHESSPSLCTYWFFARQSRSFCASYYWPDCLAGARVGGVQNVDLGKQPYGDAQFDLVVTQDVLEHVPAPDAALREIHRTLRPDKCHVFTVPRSNCNPTEARAELHVTDQGHSELQHVKPPEYHRDPINKRGSLVVTDWGVDLEQRMAHVVPGITCEAHVIQDPALGIPHPVEVFVARNPS